MTKFIKSLIIINGLIIPSGILVLVVVFAISLLPGSHGDPDSVAVENVITNKGDTIITQGIKYNDPKPILNSKNFYIKIMAKTYDNPLKIGSGTSFERGSYYQDNPCLNVLFLDKEFNVFGRLLDRKAYISFMIIPSDYNEEKIDTTIKNIGYIIAFNDSNNDKKLNENDYSDLYISDLKGKGFLQITKGIDVQEFSFINHHEDIFISYTDRNDIQDDYKKRRFAIYNIRLNKFAKLSSIDNALNEIQQILN
jgi:hypothetical protein